MQPEPNIRIGTQMFKDLIDRFGGAYYALASYNAGEPRVAQWKAQKPDLPQDEFIDDIPFPETQNYVKRILGTAEDYRRLYGTGLLDPNEPLHVSGQSMTPVRISAGPTPKRKATSAKKTTAKKAAPAKKAPAKKSSPKKGSAPKTSRSKPARPA
jgi:hypothetical protein